MPPQPSLNTYFYYRYFFIYINTYLYKEKEKITHNLKLFSSSQERDEQRRPSSYFFIRCGDSSSAFPESVTDQWARRFIHQESQLHRLFILPRRPTSEARPIKVSHFCPDACHLTQINQKYPSCLALFFMCHLSWFLCLCSITFLTSNEEWIFFFGILWCDPQVKAANEMHILELSQYTKSKEDVRGAKAKPCVNSTLPHVNKRKFPRLSLEQHKSTDVRKKMFVSSELSHPNTVGLLPVLCALSETHGVHVVLFRSSGRLANNVDSQI